MKYIFAAIDARLARPKDGKAASQVPRGTRPTLNPDELKRLIIEASEAVDDKSAANDFQETLERIVNEIRNTTEHSGPFLQKVRKADVPDYYDVIKRPMDLATLLKKVKQQSYRTKKAFAEDLDLIWSNCLLYNSHPSHPLRHSAEALRAKSNQLLEFITDPALTQRQLLLASVTGHDARRAASTRIGTPDEDADAEADSDEDDSRSKRAISERLLNGVNGDSHRGSSASPAPSRSATPSLARRLNRKVSTGPLARISASPEPLPPRPPADLPFEEHRAFLRTPEGMQEFLLLDQELARLEGSGFKSVRSSALLPPTAFGPPLATDLVTAPKKRKKEHVAEMIGRLNAAVLPTTSSSPRAAADSPSEPSVAPTSAPPPITTCSRDPEEPLEDLWWDIVGPTGASSSLLFSGSAGDPEVSTAPKANGVNGHVHASSSSVPPSVPPAPSAPPALAAGMPRAPWVGYCATPYASAVGFSTDGTRAGVSKRGKGKARAPPTISTSAIAAAPAPTSPKSKSLDKKRSVRRGEEDLSLRMRRNCETLKRIRRVGDTLARESVAGEMESPYVSAEEELEDDDAAEGVGPRRRRPGKRKRTRPPAGLVRVSSIPKEAIRHTATRGVAAREAMRAFGAGMLEHAGFEGASGGSLDVLGHLAGEYLSNLGRTLRFYVDRYSTDMSEKDILNRTLSENGVPSPAHLSAHLTDDVDRYGQRLSDLLSKLERARQEQLDSFFAPSAAADEELSRAEKVFDDMEAFVTGDWASRIGEDYFGLAEQGLDTELALPNLVLPKWLLRGEPRPLDNESAVSTLAYSPPPSFVPLTPAAISAQIGLLQPYLNLRASHASLGLTEDPALSPSALALAHGGPTRAKAGGTRHKVPPSGRIPFKGKKRPEDPTLPAAMAALLQGANEPVKKKKRSKALAAIEETVVVESGAE